jgi:hypothetical protein
VYPTSDGRLYVELRRELTAQSAAARRAGLGVWAADRTTAGFPVTSRQQVQDELVVLPKLFRRLAHHLGLQALDDVDLAGFSAFLAARDDRLSTVPDGHATALDTRVRVDGQQVVMTVPPERIVFLEG